MADAMRWSFKAEGCQGAIINGLSPAFFDVVCFFFAFLLVFVLFFFPICCFLLRFCSLFLCVCVCVFFFLGGGASSSLPGSAGLFCRSAGSRQSQTYKASSG